jgi:hypothetical protein
MQAANRILFLTENFSSLQGLKTIPIGLAVIGIAWLESQPEEAGTGRDIGLPLLLLVGGLLAYEIIDRLYRSKFGQIRRGFTQRLPEILMGLLTAIASYAAYWLDEAVDSIGSPLGVTVALLLGLEYLRTSRRVQGRYNGYVALFAITLLVLSILPALGVKQWWLAVGFQSQTLAILAALGLMIVLMGIWSHLTLLRLLRESEVAREPSL